MAAVLAKVQAANQVTAISVYESEVFKLLVLFFNVFVILSS